MIVSRGMTWDGSVKIQAKQLAARNSINGQTERPGNIFRVYIIVPLAEWST